MVRLRIVSRSCLAVVANITSVMSLGDSLLHSYSKPSSASSGMLRDSWMIPFVSISATPSSSSSFFISLYEDAPALVKRSI
ncbi:hypothetical protein H6787_00935 [Candidatus Nomurabacteria bacterium]|nr:hypothetical protein [Candidatus Nomurabacteria bacterium]